MRIKKYFPFCFYQKKTYFERYFLDCYCTFLPPNSPFISLTFSISICSLTGAERQRTNCHKCDVREFEAVIMAEWRLQHSSFLHRAPTAGWVQISIECMGGPFGLPLTPSCIGCPNSLKKLSTSRLYYIIHGGIWLPLKQIDSHSFSITLNGYKVSENV